MVFDEQKKIFRQGMSEEKKSGTAGCTMKSRSQINDEEGSSGEFLERLDA
jgi:hypothetical protein